MTDFNFDADPTNPRTNFQTTPKSRLLDYMTETVALVKCDDLDDELRATFHAEAQAISDELSRRRDGDDVATDGGTDTVDAVLDDMDVGDDHYLRHVTPSDYTFKIRHDGHIETDVEDGVVVHKITEQFSDDAHGDSLSFEKARYKCPIHPDDTESTQDHDDTLLTTRYTCSADGCPFEVVAGNKAGEEYDTPDYRRPLFCRATVPHEEDDDMAERFDKLNGDDVDVEDAANVARRWLLNGFTSNVRDAAYVKADYEIKDDGTMGDKKADAYIDTFECGKCGDEVDVGAERTHPHFGDVCPDCEDATVWDPEDADVPDDVADRMDDHASFSRSKIVALLRDVMFYPNYVAVNDDDTDAEDAPAVRTGKQGKRDMGDGDYRRGTGLRRSSDGVFNGMTHWRTLLSDAVDTGLIRRVDGMDADDEEPNAAWEATQKGRDVYSELARCRTCGGEKKPFKRTSHYQAGRRHETSTSLVTRCPTCDFTGTTNAGAMTLSTSHESEASTLPGVDYE